MSGDIFDFPELKSPTQLKYDEAMKICQRIFYVILTSESEYQKLINGAMAQCSVPKSNILSHTMIEEIVNIFKSYGWDAKHCILENNFVFTIVEDKPEF